MRISILAIAALTGMQLPVVQTVAQPVVPAGPPDRMPVVSYPMGTVSSAIAMPAAPKSAQGHAQSVRNRDGHFYVRASLNGAAVPMLVDTGASGILLRWEDAISAGLNPETMSFTSPSSTANGTAYSAQAMVRTLTVGGIARSNLPVRVAKSGALSVSLLGQTFFAQLATFRISGDTLLLAE